MRNTLLGILYCEPDCTILQSPKVTQKEPTRYAKCRIFVKESILQNVYPLPCNILTVNFIEVLYLSCYNLLY